MAFVGSLSGSLGTIAVTGSLIPVSVSNNLGSPSSKWQTVFANNLTGSIQKTGGGQDFIKAGPNITANYNGLGQWEITGASAPSAPGQVFTEASAVAAYTTSSIAIGFNAAASSKGTDVFFVVSGSTPGANTSLFAGPVVSSGSITVKDNGNIVATITGPGVISGSGLQTVGNLAVQGTSALTGDVTFGGNIVADANEAKSIFAAVTSNAITVGGAGSSVDVAGNLKVSGNQISGSAGGNILLGAAGAVTVAGNLTVNGGLTGSIQKTTNGQDFIKAGPNVTANYNSLGQWEITGTASSAPSYFTEAALNKIYTTGSVAVGFAGAASSKGTDVFFAVSSSNPAVSTSTFSGPSVGSGSFTLKDNLTNVPVANIDVAGVISGSGLQSAGNLFVQGTSSLVGNVTVTGDVAVNGGDITTTAATFNLVNTNATTVNIAGAASSTFIGAPSGRVVVPGDLEVQGTTTTVSSSNLIIKDPLVGFGFASGAVPASSTGDRGFIGAYVGSGNSNVAFGYSLSNTAFVATKTNSDSTSTTFNVADLQPIRASRFQVSGSTAELKGNGSTIQLSGSQIDLLTGPNGTQYFSDGANFFNVGLAGSNVNLAGQTGYDLTLRAGNNVNVSGSTAIVQHDAANHLTVRTREGGSYVRLLSSSLAPGAGGSAAGEGNVAKLLGLTATSLVREAASGKNVILSGSTVYANAAANGFVFQNNGGDIFKVSTTAVNTVTLDTQGPSTTLNLGTTTPTTINIGTGSASTVNIGTISGKTTVNNDLFLRTGIVAVSTNATPITLISSGNIVSKLDINNDGAGHYFDITNWNNDSQFRVYEDSGAHVSGTLAVSGSTTLGRSASDRVTFNATVNSSILPAADVTHTLGSSDFRWAHIYTGDLHLRNERGDYTLIEEPDFLSIRFNKNGKRYKFLLERVPELDESR